MVDADARRWLVHRGVFPEEFPVPGSYSAGAVHSDHILIVLSDLDHNSSLVPFGWVRSELILDPHVVADD